MASKMTETAAARVRIINSNNLNLMIFFLSNHNARMLHGSMLKTYVIDSIHKQVTCKNC